MATETKRSKTVPLFVWVIFALCLAYANGKRIADISETPSSERPWAVVIDAARR